MKSGFVASLLFSAAMLAGCSGYIYWYLRAHWAFVGTGESQYGADNKRDELLPRAFVMSHFSKNVTGSTRLTTSRDKTSGEGDAFEYSAYIKGDSLIVMAIDTIATARDLLIKLPYKVNSGTLWLSTGNESDKLCQKSEIDIPEPTEEVLVEMPARSLSTFIFMIDRGGLAIEDVAQKNNDGPKTYYDLRGRRMETPHGLCIERSANGQSRKLVME